MNEPTIADLPCRCCDGRGLFPRHVDAHTLVITEYHDWTCPICQARGVMRLQFPDVSVNCGPCQGTGRRYKKSTLTLPARSVKRVADSVSCR
jgi:DnaJ-class molecular chaperone